MATKKTPARKAIKPTAAQKKATTAARANAKAPVVDLAAARKAKAEAQAPKVGKRAQITADAQAGKLPQAPDWSKRTHYRAQYAKLIELVKAGDVRGLEKLELPTSITQLSRYRDLAVIALKAKGAKPAASAAAMKRAPRRA